MRANWNKQKPGAGRKRRGFTLIELIAVMGIMVTLSVIVVGSYTGIMRAISRSAAVNSLRNSLTLCRQYATVDGRRTYLWITNVDKYILCRKAGDVSSSSWQSLSGPDVPEYLVGTSAMQTSGSTETALFVKDRYADLGRGIGGVGGDAAESMVERLMGYNGIIAAGNYFAFDFTDGVMARVVYPPWYDLVSGAWVFGLRGMRYDENSHEFRDQPPSGAFSAGHEYGWTLGVEQSLPDGWAFDASCYTLDTDGNFQRGKKTYFEPNGSVITQGNMLEIKIFEVATGRTGIVRVSSTGQVTIQ